MAKDRALELLQPWAGLDPELLAEGPPSASVRLERLCLTTASVEGEHQLGAQALAVGMRGNEGLELGDERVLAPEREVRFDPGLERGQSEFLQPRDLALGEGLEGEVGKRGSAPEGERIPKRQRRAFRLTARELAPTLLQEGLEAVCVETFRRHAQHVARCLRDQELLAGPVGEQSPQLREVDVQDRVDRSRSRIAPRAPRRVARARWARSRAGGGRRGGRVASGHRARSTCRPRTTSSCPRMRNSRSECPFVAPSYDPGSASGASRARLLDVLVAFSCRLLRGSIVVTCAFSGASISQAGRFFCGSSWRSCSRRAQLPMRLRAG